MTRRIENKLNRHSSLWLYVFTVMVMALAAVAITGRPAVSEENPSFGEIPEEAWLADGSVEIDLVPEYISALDRSGEIAGYVRATDILSEESADGDGVIVVVDQNLELVGHMVPDRGFVPVGTPFESVPKYEIELYEIDEEGAITTTRVGGP